MGRTPSNAVKRRVTAVMQLRDTQIAQLSTLSEDKVTNLFYQASIPITPDALPAASMGERRGSGSHSDPTLSAVLARVNHRDDALVERARSLVTKMHEGFKAWSEVVDMLDYNSTSVDRERGHVSTEPCPVCGVQAVQKSGFCLGCYNDWYQHGSPDRPRWMMWKQATVNSEGSLLVSECPPPALGHKARRGPFRVSTTDNHTTAAQDDSFDSPDSMVLGVGSVSP